MLDYTALLRKLTPDRDGEPDLRLRAGTVAAVNSDGTLDITMSSGALVPDVPKLDKTYVAVGAVVQMLALRGSMLVLGPTSQGSAEVSAFNSANPTTVSTSYTSLAGGDILGVAFIAPPSGSVEVVIQGWSATSSATIGRRSFMSAQIREGSTINAGTVFLAPNDEAATLAENNATTGFGYRYVHHVRIVTGLTPGNSYNAVVMHKVNTSGDSNAANDRYIIVRPI